MSRRGEENVTKVPENWHFIFLRFVSCRPELAAHNPQSAALGPGGGRTREAAQAAQAGTQERRTSRNEGNREQNAGAQPAIIQNTSEVLFLVRAAL